jgi:DNA modification methylase
MKLNHIIHGDALEELKLLPNESIDVCITSPPYFNLRDYKVTGQMGRETSVERYIDSMCSVFDEVRRVLKKEGSCWVNLGDTYKDKCLLQIPERFSIEMVNRGYILRNSIIWHKPAVMPQSVKDRYTNDYEMLYFFVKSKKYYFKQQIEKATYTDFRHGRGLVAYTNRETSCNVIVSDIRNKRAVWKVANKPCKEYHSATYPDTLIESPVDACCPINGIIIDPFMGSGTTAVVALRQEKNYIGIELNKDYIEIANRKINK